MNNSTKSEMVILGDLWIFGELVWNDPIGPLRSHLRQSEMCQLMGRNHVCFHLWCELTLVLWCRSIVWSLFSWNCNGMTSFVEFMCCASVWRKKTTFCFCDSCGFFCISLIKSTLWYHVFFPMTSCWSSWTSCCCWCRIAYLDIKVFSFLHLIDYLPFLLTLHA